MAYDWRWDVFLERVDGDDTYLGWLASGARITVALSLGAWILALALGSVIGVLRTVPRRAVATASAAYVELFRNVPLLVQLFIWYFVVPELVPAALGNAFKALHPTYQLFLPSVIGLAFFTSARIAEQVRAGIEALSGGQRSAALALGLTLPQAYRHVLVPVAFRIIVPPLASEMVNHLKNSAVASTLGLIELAAMGTRLVDYTARTYESLIAVTLAFVVLNLVILALMRWVEVKARLPGYLGGGR